jgi:hypothetical protein
MEEIEMEEPTSATGEKTDAEYEAEVNALLAQMQQMNEKSDRTGEETERLKAESETIRAGSDVIAARIDRRLDSIFDLLQRMEHDRKLDQLRHENLVLRLENTLLRFERRLPPGAAPNDLGLEPS